MEQPKKDKTAINAAVVAEINKFAKTNLSEADLKAYNLHCFSDAGLGVHTCNPLAPLPDGTMPPPDEENYCSLHFICAVHLGARYGVGLKSDEPYDFDKSKAHCEKLGYDVLVKAIREKQQSTPAEEPSAPVLKPVPHPPPQSTVEVLPAETPKVRPRRLQKSAPEQVLTVPKAIEITDANEKAAEPAKKTKVVKPAKKTKPAKKIKVIKASKKPAAKPVKASKKSKPAKPAKPVKKPAKGKPVAAKAKPAKSSKAKPAKAKPAKLVSKKPAEKKPVLSVKGQRGRPRTREYDPAVHCPTKKPAYWRTIGTVKAYVPDHKLTVEEVRERLRVGGFRAETGSRMGVLLDQVLHNGGASLATLQKTWEKHDYKLQPLTHLLKIAVKIGAFSMKGDKYVLGGHA